MKLITFSLWTLASAITINYTDTYLDTVVPFYERLKPHGTCNPYKTYLFGDRFCTPPPDVPVLPRPHDLNALHSLTNLSQAIVVIDERLRDHALLLRGSSQRLEGADKDKLKAIVETAAIDLGAFRSAFDNVYDTIVSSMEKVRVTLKTTNMTLTRLRDAFVKEDEDAFTYNMHKFEKNINILLNVVKPIPDLLSKRRADAHFEQQKMIDLVASTERHIDTYWFADVRKRLGFYSP